VPQPSSIASMPLMSSGSICSSASGTPQMPQLTSPLDQLRWPVSSYSLAHWSQAARFFCACSGRSLIASTMP
jgi:hypothetical protein